MEELRTIARPYASAVFDIANNKEMLSEWSVFLKKASELLDQKDIRVLIKTPGMNKKPRAEQGYGVILSSAARLPEEDIEEIKQALSKKLGKKIKLNNSVDETLIGGAVIKIGDHMIDGSVRSQLKKMTRFLTN